eukprot:Polyplicarium_translucidae@DN3288_c1_g1_i3.p1
MKLIKLGFIYRAVHKPAPTSASSGMEANDQSAGGTVKWPKRLQFSPVQDFLVDGGFYVVLYESNTTWKYVLLCLLIAAVLFICMFPAWPLRLKLACWYILVGFSSLMLVMVIVRLIVFTGAWFAGCDFWLWPNLFVEEAGVIESFMPLYEFERRKDEWFMMVARAFGVVLVVASCYQLNKVHPITGAPSFAAQQFLDVVAWGENFLNGSDSEGLSRAKARFAPFEVNKKRRGVRDLQDFMDDDDEDEEDDVAAVEKGPDGDELACLAGCMQDVPVLSDCLEDCGCVTALLKSSCFPECDQAGRFVVVEAKLDACADEDDGHSAEL